MPEEITLRLDRTTAEDLYAAMSTLGEHVAAGMPIAAPSRGEAERLGVFLRDLGHSIGRRCSPSCEHVLVRSRRRADTESRRAAINGVAAYLEDEEAEVYNIADVAVRQDAMGLALNLIALDATAVAALAIATGDTPGDALRSMQPEV
ncbi:hypothetical protein KBX37_21655 [Micromonospora sp. U56]|uniref:hypothetical protein n=1 Tax=Micromonospora sp. U56 TaxID=2824900 RepID=UPI001B37388A|nr:hypothetical protein [Micromonospora sp. U56]MBQ0895668.1 hypothetical protein [Micromonospora sp. U56]